MLQAGEVDYVIYHKNCADGFGSALAAWLYAKNSNKVDNVIFFAATHGMEPPSDVNGKNLLICDFSYSKATINKLLTKVNKLLIIDHHKSAEKELTDVASINKIFDMSHSGAYLTWCYFFGTDNIPLLIKYIEDRDIWTKKLPQTDEFAYWFFTIEYKFEEYAKYLDQELLLQCIKNKGPAFKELNDFYIRQAMDHVVIKFIGIKDKFYFVGLTNMSILQSDVGNKIMLTYPNIDFSLVYNINDAAGVAGNTRFSLRSTNDHVDVSEIATLFGGGGHRNASGASVGALVNHLPGVVYDVDYYILDKVKPINYKNKLAAYVSYGKYKNKLAKYLLQNRGANQIGSILTKNKDRHQLAIVHSYDANEDRTCLVFAFDSSLSTEEIEQLRLDYKLDHKDRLVVDGLVNLHVGAKV